MAFGTVHLDRYVEGRSALHLADARVKLPVTLGFIVATSVLPPGAWAWYALMLAVAWAAVVASGVGLRRMLGRSALALPFVLAAVPTIFTRAGNPAGSLALGPWTLVATDAGLVMCGSVFLKSWASITAAALLAATTPSTVLIDALYTLRVPPTLVRIVAFMHRYLFVLVEEVQRMLRARAARSAAISPKAGGPIAWRARVTGGMAGALFVRTYDRSERIHMAMVARGFNGVFRQRQRPPVPGATRAVAVGLVLLFAAITASAYLVI